MSPQQPRKGKRHSAAPAGGPPATAPDGQAVRDEPALLVSREQVAAWLEADHAAFLQGDRGAWIRALGLAKLCGLEAPRWAWEFVVAEITAWHDAPNATRLDDVLGVRRPGHDYSRRMNDHKGTVYFVAKRLEQQRPGWRKEVGQELFWTEVARVVAEEFGAPSFGWTKAKAMAADYRKWHADLK